MMAGLNKVSYRLGIAVALFIIMSHFFSTVMAISLDQRKVFNSGVYYFDINPGNALTTGSSCLIGSDNEVRIWNYLTGTMGLSATQAAGVMGNIKSETAGTWDPRIVQGGSYSDTPVPGAGYGLAQWTTDSRQQGLVERANAAGVIPGDLGVQLDYLRYELTQGGYKSAGDQLKNIADGDLQGATFLILISYEAPKDIEGNKPVRLSYAQEIFNLYSSNSGSAGTGSTCTGGTGGGTISGCQNPFSGIPNLQPLRVDQGNDYSGDGPVHPACSGKITYYNTSSGWPGGNAISYEVTGGAANGLTIFVTENCTLNPNLRVGDPVDTSTVLCTMHSSSPWIETGWAQKGTDLPLARQVDSSCYNPDGIATNAGLNFADFMKAIGSTPGNPNQSTNWPATACPLPTGWPTW